MKRLSLLILIFCSFFTVADEKAELVNAIMQESSIKISLNAIPGQLAQLPATLPMPENGDPAKFQRYMQDFTQEVLTSFNEAEALDQISQYFVQHGETDKLETTLAWLQSPAGRTITNNEIRTQTGDTSAMLTYMQTFTPQSVPAERQVMYKELINAMDMSALISGPIKKLLPAMMRKVGRLMEQDEKAMEQTIQEFASVMETQLNAMQDTMAEQMQAQMLAALSFQFTDISDADLRAYIDYFKSEAGQHYIDLSLASTMSYSLQWLGELLPMQDVQAVQ